MPEPCCVSLSTSTHLPLTNLLPKGIKCRLSVSAVAVTLEGGRQQQISPSCCPFDFKREIALAPRTSENITVSGLDLRKLHHRQRNRAGLSACVKVFVFSQVQHKCCYLFRNECPLQILIPEKKKQFLIFVFLCIFKKKKPRGSQNIRKITRSQILC